MDEKVTETVEITEDAQAEQSAPSITALGEIARRYLLAALGAAAVTGENIASAVDSAVGPTIDKLVERGQALEQEHLQGVSKVAHQTVDAAAGVTRQATSIASSRAGTFSDVARKQAKTASTGALTAIIKQLDALQTNLTHLRETLETELETRDDKTEAEELTLE